MSKYYTDYEDSWKAFAFSNITALDEKTKAKRGKIYFVPHDAIVEIQNFSAISLKPVVENAIKAYAAKFQTPVTVRHKNWRSSDLSGAKSLVTDLTKLEITAGEKMLKVYAIGQKSATLSAIDNLLRRAMHSPEGVCVLIHLYNLKFPRQSALATIDKRFSQHPTKAEIHLLYNGEYWQELQ